MKKPIKKDFCKPFSLDDNLIHFDSKSYSKQAELYIEQMENEKRELIDALQEVLKYFNPILDAREECMQEDTISLIEDIIKKATE